MAKIDLVRRAQIGREKRARTRGAILEAGAMLLAERPPEALRIDDAVVEGRRRELGGEAPIIF